MRVLSCFKVDKYQQSLKKHWVNFSSADMPIFQPKCCLHSFNLEQGHLKIWTGHSKLILPNSKQLEISLPKFQHFYNYEKYDFSPNLKGVAQKMDPPHPWEVFNVFGRKSKF